MDSEELSVRLPRFLEPCVEDLYILLSVNYLYKKEIRNTQAAACNFRYSVWTVERLLRKSLSLTKPGVHAVLEKEAVPLPLFS